MNEHKNNKRQVFVISHKKHKETTIEYIPGNGESSKIIISDNKIIELQHAIITLSINKELIESKDMKEIQLTKQQLELSFEIVYDHEYIIICSSYDDYIFLTNSIGIDVKSYGIFGLPLYTTIRKTGWRIPLVVYRCIEFLKEKKGENIEGIFRLNGSNDRLNEMKQLIETDTDFQFKEDDSCLLASSLLKLYLRTLIDPLIPTEHFDYYMNITSHSIEENKNYIESLPIVNQDTLWYVIDYLKVIVKNQEINKMNETNISTCFSLVISRNPDNSTLNELEFTKKTLISFQYILEHFDELFIDIQERNLAEGIIPPQYPAFDQIIHLPFSILTETIKTDLKSFNKIRRSSSHSTQKKENGEKRKTRISLSFLNFSKKDTTPRKESSSRQDVTSDDLELSSISFSPTISPRKTKHESSTPNNEIMRTKSFHSLSSSPRNDISRSRSSRDLSPSHSTFSLWKRKGDDKQTFKTLSQSSNDDNHSKDNSNNLEITITQSDSHFENEKEKKKIQLKRHKLGSLHHITNWMFKNHQSSKSTTPPLNDENNQNDINEESHSKTNEQLEKKKEKKEK